MLDDEFPAMPDTGRDQAKVAAVGDAIRALDRPVEALERVAESLGTAARLVNEADTIGLWMKSDDCSDNRRNSRINAGSEALAGANGCAHPDLLSSTVSDRCFRGRAASETRRSGFEATPAASKAGRGAFEATPRPRRTDRSFR